MAGPDQLFVSTESVDLSGPLADRDLVGNETHGQAYFPIYIVIRPLAAGTPHKHTREGGNIHGKATSERGVEPLALRCITCV